MLESYKLGVLMSRNLNEKITPIRYAESPPVIELLFDTIGRGVVFVNSDGIVTFMNKLAEDILQAKRSSVITTMWPPMGVSSPFEKA